MVDMKQQFKDLVKKHVDADTVDTKAIENMKKRNEAIKAESRKVRGVKE